MKNNIKHFLLLTLGVIVSFTISSFASSDTKSEEKAASTALVPVSKSSALVAVSNNTALTLSVAQRSSVWAQNSDEFALMLPPPPVQLVPHPGPHDIQYEVVYTFEGAGTRGPVRLFNNLRNGNTDAVVFGLGVSGAATKKRPQYVCGNHSYTFAKVPEDKDYRYTTVIRIKGDTTGATPDVDHNWFKEHCVNTPHPDEDHLLHMGEPFMFLQLGKIPEIDLSGR